MLMLMLMLMLMSLLEVDKVVNMVVEMELVNEFEYQSSAWVTRLECMKAVNDEVKQARRDQSPPERPQAGPYRPTLLLWIFSDYG